MESYLGRPRLQVKRNKLIKCTCALLVDGSPLDMEDPTMCPGRSPGDGASL